MSVRDTKDSLDENDPAFRDARGVEIAITAGRAKVIVAIRNGEVTVQGNRVDSVDDKGMAFLAEDMDLGKAEVAVISQINEA